jgi:hypothetical protein
MQQAHEYLAFYLKQLREGRDVDDASHSLMEGDQDLLAPLMAACTQEENRHIRPDIVRCIWQHRNPTVIRFLGQLLHDSEPAVWQEALDGLVAIGGSEAIVAVESSRGVVPSECVEEALTQLREASPS